MTYTSTSADSARITVQLPAKARLFVDNVECPLTSDLRSFLTPKLEPGKRYYYTLRMERLRDGRVTSETRQVIVVAGRHVQVDFNSPALVSTVAR